VRGYLNVFGRPLQVTVRPTLRYSDPVCPVCLLGSPVCQLSVTMVYCGQAVGWIKMPLGTEVGLCPRDIMLDEDPALSMESGTTAPLFGPCLLWPEAYLRTN